MLVVAGGAVARTVRFERAEAADARAIGFADFEARGLHQTRAEVYDGLRPSVQLDLRARRAGELFASQRAARGDDLEPPECIVHDGTRYSAYQGPCRAARTPQGRVVTLADAPDPSLLAVRDGTLVVAGSWQATEADLLAYADALRPVDARDVDWER